VLEVQRQAVVSKGLFVAVVLELTTQFAIHLLVFGSHLNPVAHAH
jgi:hypothetical protein